MKKVILFFAVALSSVLLMAQTNQITWVNGRAVLGQSISSIDSIKYGTIVDADQLVLWLPKTIIVHDTVIVHDTIIINKCDSSHAPEGVEMVDLGLPSGIKWANMNVGATSITDFGCYFAWGETELITKAYYHDTTYKFYKDTIITTINKEGFEEAVRYKGYTKYVHSSDATKKGYNGFFDDKTILDLEDDAAHVNWGGNWRMPTAEDWGELVSNCTWQKIALNGVNGYKVIGSNEKWIFLPAAGYRYHNSLFSNDMKYWSSSLDKENSGGVRYLSFLLGEIRWNSESRFNGQSVRPVCQ